MLGLTAIRPTFRFCRVAAVHLSILLLLLLPNCHLGRDSAEDIADQYRTISVAENESLESFLGRVSAHFETPSIAAAVVTADGIIDSAAVGLRRTDRPDSVTIGDLYHIGSVVKPITGTLAGILVERGQISWDLRVIDCFAENADEIDTSLMTVTFGDILSHTAGLPAYYGDSLFDFPKRFPGLTGSVTDQRREITLRQFLAGTSLPVGEYSYSNGGYVIAAAIMEKVTGQSYEELIEQHIAAPLGITSLTYGWPDDSNYGQPSGHYFRDAEGVPVPIEPDARRLPITFNPAGNIAMSITDLARFGLFHLEALAGRNDRLSRETAARIHTPAISDTADGYGYGWGIIFSEESKISSHSGSAQTFYAMITINHVEGIAVVVATNAGDARAAEACGNVTVGLLDLVGTK